jgi:broad specificity phosphatase PhoE
MGKAGGLTEQEVVEMFPLEWAKSGGDAARFWEEIQEALEAEDHAGFLQRVMATLGEIVAAHPQDQDTVVVVTHSAVHSTYLAQLVEGDPRKWPEYDAWRPCGLTELEVVEGKGKIIALNDCRHLANPSESRPK